MKQILLGAFLTLGLLTAGAIAPVAAQTATGALDRTVLPIQEPDYPPITELDARNATPPPRFEVKAPEGAPNVLIVLIDDMGFGMSSAFGGPIHMMEPIMFSTDETADVGVDDATPVVEGMGVGRHTRFTGKIDRVTVELK